MIEGANPVLQALLGTLLTWGLTAAGAACVILAVGYQVRSLHFTKTTLHHYRCGYFDVQRCFRKRLTVD